MRKKNSINITVILRGWLSPAALIHPELHLKAENLSLISKAMSVIQVVSVYNDLSSPSRAHATLRLLCRERERKEDREEEELMERDRQRQRDHMEFHSFRFLSQMLFSN